MNPIELSEHLRENYPASKLSLSIRKPKYGMATNDSDYATGPVENGVRKCCPAYIAWNNMLMRVYSSSYHAKQPTYIGSAVCDEWHSFMVFREWWINHYVDGWHLDKDLICVGNREYNPKSCVYVPQWLNNLTSSRDRMRGGCPIGVTFDKDNGKYIARCRNPIHGGKDTIGRFISMEDAYLAYRQHKLMLVDLIKDKILEIDPRIYDGVVASIASKV